ncbi:hypothetical protein [Abyssisolibacter fermentans]|uniref:hypothetical protein n=1 Tax=Abyssisolibacter fermentans TaxID=1766203 RepID=UPI000829738C|nr:hypothetical protein [Abyssisolibacter fermentans]
MKLEHIKTCILTVLFIVSILLCQKLMTGISFNTNFLFNPKTTVASIKYKEADFIAPEKYIVNYSEQNHKVIYSNEKYKLWELSQTALTKFLQDKDIIIEDQGAFNGEIISEMYVQKSLLIKLDQEMDFRFINSLLDIQNGNKIYKKIKSIDTIYFYLGTDEYMMLANNSQYIKIKSDNYKLRELSRVIDAIKSDEELTKYYPGDAILFIGEEKRDVFVPVNITKKISNPYVIDYISQNETEEIINQFFDKDINYVRKIVQGDDTRIYMYAQDSLVVKGNGVIEYYGNLKETVFESDLYVSFSSAINFIARKTKFIEEIYLKSIEDVKDGESEGYKFGFSYKINHKPVELSVKSKNLNYPIEVVVYGDKVIQYKSCLREVGPNTKPFKIMSPKEVIETNFNYIFSDFQNNDSNEEVMNKEEFLKNINNIYFKYYDLIEENPLGRLTAAWVMEIGNNIYVYDAKNGKLIEKNLSVH